MPSKDFLALNPGYSAADMPGANRRRTKRHAPELARPEGDDMSTHTLEVTLDTVPPSLNNIYTTVEVDGHSRRMLTSDAARWKKGAAWTIRAAANQQGWTVKKKVPLYVTVLYAAPDVLRWDLDGKPKLLLDALCDAFGIDDRYVMRLDQAKARAPLAQVRLCVSTGEIAL